MNINDIITTTIEKGWLFSLQLEPDGFVFSVARLEWMTNNLYASRACPTYRGDTMEELIENIPSNLKP